MTDNNDLLTRFENQTIIPGTFRHRDHVHLTWLLLQEHTLLESLNRLSPGLKRMAASAGAPEKYHETITWAYAFLINERIHKEPSERNFESFAADNADLLNWQRHGLSDFYSPNRLQSSFARSVFVLPDRLCGRSP
ncbi:MAG: hypothetical protein MI923_11645 [Phycisphaerales bacterium]|nr:hypothetical protein [Phycisphaerales bacterium]